MGEDSKARAPVGRPKIHADKKAAQAEASKQYRSRQKAKKLKADEEAAQSLAQKLQSSVIDLSAIPPWRRR